MGDTTAAQSSRRPRFRRSEKLLSFRVTDDDVEIVGHIAQHRFLRSSHVAALVGRSLDRTNDRLCHLYHAGYIDRPRAQLDYYPSTGSAPMVYALADRGVDLLRERLGLGISRVEWAGKNREAGRPFIEHQLEISDFRVALQHATVGRSDIRLIGTDELIATFPEATRRDRNPVSIRVDVSWNGKTRAITLIPDLIFGLGFSDNSRRCFMVEIDRGTMPISRADITQTSFERKIRAYASAYEGNEHMRRFGWKAFRVLTVTTDKFRAQTILNVLRTVSGEGRSRSLFFFALRNDLALSNPIAHTWCDGDGEPIRLI